MGSEAICQGKPTKFLWGDLQWTCMPSREVAILIDASCYRNQDNLQLDGPHALSADFTHLQILQTLPPRHTYCHLMCTKSTLATYPMGQGFKIEIQRSSFVWTKLETYRSQYLNFKVKTFMNIKKTQSNFIHGFVTVQLRRLKI